MQPDGRIRIVTQVEGRFESQPGRQRKLQAGIRGNPEIAQTVDSRLKVGDVIDTDPGIEGIARREIATEAKVAVDEIRVGDLLVFVHGQRTDV